MYKKIRLIIFIHQSWMKCYNRYSIIMNLISYNTISKCYIVTIQNFLYTLIILMINYSHRYKGNHFLNQRING